MTYPEVTFEYFPRGDEDKKPHRAHIRCERSEHHGIGATPAEALLNAVTHWNSYEKARTQKEATE